MLRMARMGASSPLAGFEGQVSVRSSPRPSPHQCSRSAASGSGAVPCTGAATLSGKARSTQSGSDTRGLTAPNEAPEALGRALLGDAEQAGERFADLLAAHRRLQESMHEFDAHAGSLDAEELAAWASHLDAAPHMASGYMLASNRELTIV